MTAPDHAREALEVVRAVLSERGTGDRAPEDYDSADDALAVVEQRLTELEGALRAHQQVGWSGLSQPPPTNLAAAGEDAQTSNDAPPDEAWYGTSGRIPRLGGWRQSFGTRAGESSMSRRLITHEQYEELRRYEDGHAHYVFRSPKASLTQRGWLERVPRSGETRASSAWRITDRGRTACAAYRQRWGIALAAAGEDAQTKEGM